MNKKVWSCVSAHGYEFPPDGFGIRGASLETKPGGTARLKMNASIPRSVSTGSPARGSIAYRDARPKPPIAEPLLNAGVTGQDGILNAIYRGKLYWFYGDTEQASYALGNFAMCGATTEKPDQLDPSVGLNLKYFVGGDGTVRAMAPIQGEGVVWLFGVVVIPTKPDGIACWPTSSGAWGLARVGEAASSSTTTRRSRSRSSRTCHRIRDLPAGLPLPQQDRRGPRRIDFTDAMTPREGRLEIVSGPGLLRGLHVPQARTRYISKERAQFDPTPPETRLGMETRHATTGSESANADRRGHAEIARNRRSAWRTPRAASRFS